jgi:predicted RNA-binding protein YlqC (UPF0109 family)
MISTQQIDAPDQHILFTLATMLRSLVDKPNEIDLRVDRVNEVNVVRVSCAAEDLGKIIGKQGRTARSIRTILGATCMKHNRRYALDIQGHTPKEERES